MNAIYNSLADARRAYARGRRYLVNHGVAAHQLDKLPQHIDEKVNSGAPRYHTRPPSLKSARLEMARDRRRAKAERIMQAMARVLAAKKEEQS